MPKALSELPAAITSVLGLNDSPYSITPVLGHLTDLWRLVPGQPGISITLSVVRASLGVRHILAGLLIKNKAVA